MLLVNINYMTLYFILTVPGLSMNYDNHADH